MATTFERFKVSHKNIDSYFDDENQALLHADKLENLGYDVAVREIKYSLYGTTETLVRLTNREQINYLKLRAEREKIELFIKRLNTGG